MTKAVLIKKLQDETGATAIEYGLIVAAIGAALAVIIFLLGDEVQGTFQSILDTLAG